MITRILFIANCFAICGISFSQVYETSRYADHNGLPSRIVHDVIQDKQGFIWVGGNNGLFRFDGKHFEAYKANLKDTLGLRNNRINVLMQSADGKIWLGTPMGLHTMEEGEIRYVELIEDPEESHLYILSIFEDRQNRIWVGTYNGVFLIEPGSSPIHFLKEGQVGNLSNEAIWHITQDNQDKIWVSTNSGPYVMETSRYEFAPITLEFDKDLPIEDYKFFQNWHLNDTTMLLGTSKGLLHGKRVGEDKMVIEYLKDVQDDRIAEYYVDEFLVAKDSSIYLATWKNGFKKIISHAGAYEEVEMISRNGWQDMSGEVKGVFEDKQGNIWVANTNGLYKVSEPTTEVLTFPPRYDNNCLNDFYGIYGILQDKKGYFWVTTPSALYRFSEQDLYSGSCPKEYLHFSDEGMFRARDLFIDSYNRLWIGSTNGLFVTQLDAEQNPAEFIRYTTENGLPHNWCYEMEQIDDDNYWLANYAGFVKVSLEDGNLKNPRFTVYVHDDDLPESLTNSQVYDIEMDAKGHVWIGTFSGVSRLVNEFGEGLFENYTSTFGDVESLSNNSIKEVFLDSKDHLWMATQRGLNRYDPVNNTFEQFGHAEGLPSEYVLGLAEDSKGFLWICTTNGVLKASYDEIERRLVPEKHYTSKNGLVDNIPYRNSIFIDSLDNAIIGSRDGISIVKAKKERNSDPPRFDLALTALGSINNKDKGFQSVIHRVKNNGLNLPHNANSIRIAYASLDFLKPEFNSYRHKVLPNNDTWIETGNENTLTFYNLPVGEYEFVLDGTNNFGQWSNDPIALHITIAPPFWKTQWAFLVYGLFLTWVIWAAYRMRIKKKEQEWRLKTAMETAIVKQREQLRNENAADFHDELGSMVTKISMFLTMAERNFEEGKDPTHFFHKIRNNIKGLSTGFRDLLWVIDPQKDSLADTFLRLKEFGEDFFEQSTINFKTSKFQEVFEDCMLSPKTKKQVVMIFKEAMTNAIKYSDGTEAQLLLESNGAFSKMEFRDNGSGFNVSKKSKGRGLKNMEARSKKMNANIVIHSSSVGTSILLDRIPHMGDVFSDKHR